MATEYRFYSALRLAVRLVRKWFPEYALIGRFARNFYAPPENNARRRLPRGLRRP